MVRKRKRQSKARDFSVKSKNSLTSSARSRDAVFQRDDVQYNTNRSSRRKASWAENHARPLAFGIAFVVGWMFSLLIITGLGSIAAGYLAKMSSENSWHNFDPWFQSIRNHQSIFGGSLVYFAGKLWVCLPALVIATLSSVVFGKQADKRIAKLDDSAMQTDVNDSWIWSVAEMIEQYKVIADFGAHSKTTSVSSIVGHIYLKDKGLKSINMALHDDKGNILYDENGEVRRKKVPLIDRTDIRKVLDKQGLNELNVEDILIDATKYPHDEKNGRVRTLADAINEDWFIPDYEILRPMGAYFVESNSVHTLILSMTRGNKTQLVSFSTLDAWRRDNTRWNLLTNDPKIEMMMSSYQLLQRAGYDVVPFLLTHPDKSVRYNPLQMVIEDIRRGKIDKASTALDTLSTTFFPSTGGDDFWVQTARAVFQMMTYQLMNYMVEEEQRTIKLYQAEKAGRVLVDQSESLGNKVRPVIKTPAALDSYIDSLWGNANMNAMYLMISQLDALKIPDPIVAATDPKYAYNPNAEKQEVPEAISGLDVLASAIRKLPDNAVRRQFKGPDTMMNKAGGSDATVGSIYATALNSMSFFVQETIKKLTTVSPRNGLNILDYPFPRRLSVRISPLLMQRMHLASRRYHVTMYKDPFFTTPYGDKRHDTVDEGAVESSGWMDFWFQKIPRPKTKQFYVKFEILDSAEENVVLTLHFAIDKGYLLTEDGRHYTPDPVTGKPIFKDGTVFEVLPMSKQRAVALHRAGKAIKMGQMRDLHTTVKRVRDNFGNSFEEPVIAQTMFNYTERPKATFLSIPPQIEGQGKLGLTLIDSIFNTSMGKGYEVRGDVQKPDYGTRYMLEELGNLKADGKGIPALDSKLSIGLSANQQMTMVFQGLKQVSSVYGDEMYDIMKDNVGVIHYMLSENKDTVEYISELTGKTHKVDISSQNISEVIGSLDGNDNTISTTKSKNEVPVISPEVLRHLTDGETVAITATHRRDNFGRVTRTNAIFNTREQLLPFAYAVLAKQTDATKRAGKGTPETASTIYSTVDSEPDQMVPDFMQILRLTVRQAMYYAHQEDVLKDKFKEIPYGSEALSDAIMGYMNYEEDINRALIKDGLAGYMLLTKEEILTAYREDILKRNQTEVLLAQLGYDPNETLGSLRDVSDNDVAQMIDSLTMQEKHYLVTAAGLTYDEFQDFMSDLINRANGGEKQVQDLLLKLADQGSWVVRDSLTFGHNGSLIVVGDSERSAFLKIDVDTRRYVYAPSESFAEFFEGDRALSGTFSSNDLVEVISDFASEYKNSLDEE